MINILPSETNCVSFHFQMCATSRYLIETIYVEIKSATGTGITFVISENELNFAEAHPQQYEVVLVTAVMSEDERKIYRLSDLFNYADGEDRFCNSKFSITGDNYTVRCQIGVEDENV